MSADGVRRAARRGSFTFSGYDGLVRCNLEVKSCEIGKEYSIDENDRKLSKEKIEEIDTDIVTLCRRELGRLEEERRLEEEEKKERREIILANEARRVKEEQERRAQMERSARAAAERERQEFEERQRQQEFERQKREEALLRRRIEEEEAERQERIRRDESYAISLNNGELASPPMRSHSPQAHTSQDVEKLARLTALTGADEQTCRFYLDCASGDVSAAFRFWEQSNS